jgi:hypothetical protein
MRKPIRSLLKLAELLETGKIDDFDQGKYSTCIIGLSNRIILEISDDTQSETRVFANGFGVSKNFVDKIYAAQFKYVFGEGFENYNWSPIYNDEVTPQIAASVIRRVVDLIDTARTSSRAKSRALLNIKDGVVVETLA